ncbi:hypothetical protein C9374_013724 [Naegleria lovaniensis]|uniref:Uncharacterized protein n=1 Tax=Naegleria lovaniensis TaxID=51637 RepID=A0AA88GD23_NAELO|nr:uncharacterized protein C9374_013724 [Naegleria lovaniensis]KAG2370924.1 hypothetical protein C9374_013724 [Naegleria lovaniensis]
MLNSLRKLFSNKNHNNPTSSRSSDDNNKNESSSSDKSSKNEQVIIIQNNVDPYTDPDSAPLTSLQRNREVLVRKVSMTASNFYYPYNYTCGTYEYRFESRSLVFVVHSNMDFNDIAPPAVEIHQVSLMIESLSTPLHQEEKNIENTENEPISLTLTANNYMTKCSKVSPHLLRRIISEIGLDQFILSERSAWNCLMDYFRVFGYFHYDLIMHRREYIAQQISSHFGKNCSLNLSGMYDVEFTTYDSTRNMNLKSLKVAMSWEQQSLIKLKQTKSRVEGPYRVILEYNGQKLEYIEQATEKNSLLTNERNSNSSKSTNISVKPIYIHTSEILFNDEVIFKCTFPSYYESVAFKNYSPGMRIEIEQRHESHPSIKFAQIILEEVFGYKFNNTWNRSNSGFNKDIPINNNPIDEMTVEEVWTSFMEHHQFRGLCSLFSFFNPLENEFMAMNFMKLAKEKDYAVVLSDIFIKITEQ